MNHVLFYTPFLKIGGIEKVTIEYLKILVSKGVHVELLVDYDMGDGNLLLPTVPKQVKVNFIKGKMLSSFIYSLRNLSKSFNALSPFLFAIIIIIDFLFYHYKVKKILNNNYFDATITFYQFLPAYLTKHKNVTHIIWLHGSIEHFFGGYRNFFIKNYYTKLNKYFKVVTIADEMREQLKTFYPAMNADKILRIYNPVDFDLIRLMSTNAQGLSAPELSLMNKPYICHVSRVDENQKDITTLIMAFASIIEKNVVSHNLIIIGMGPDIDKLKDLSIQLGIDDKVYFIGNQLNPYVWMKRADALVLSSKFEGFGLVLVEAMALETFVISSACKTGPREILGNGRFGDLFHPGDINALAVILCRALTDHNYRDEKVRLASERILEFDREQTAKQLLDSINISVY